MKADVELTAELNDAVQFVLRRLEIFPAAERATIIRGFRDLLDCFDSAAAVVATAHRPSPAP